VDKKKVGWFGFKEGESGGDGAAGFVHKSFRFDNGNFTKPAVGKVAVSGKGNVAGQVVGEQAAGVVIGVEILFSRVAQTDNDGDFLEGVH